MLSCGSPCGGPVRIPSDRSTGVVGEGDVGEAGLTPSPNV